MTTLLLSDRCNADTSRKAPDWMIASNPGTDFSIEGDVIRVDGVTVLRRVEPHGFGDVHWEREGDEPVAFRRYTHIEVQS